MNKIFKQKNSGLTLVEVMVSMALFAILSVAFVSLFTTSMNSQAAILQNQELLNQSGYVIDYMHRFLRMATRDDAAFHAGVTPSDGQAAGACTAMANTSYGGDGPSTDIYFLGYDTIAGNYKCMRFWLDTTDNKIKITKYSNTGQNSGTTLDITSATVKVNDLKFSVTGDNNGGTIDALQPKVTIMLDMQSASRRVSPIPRMLIQTSASQRNLDVP